MTIVLPDPTKLIDSEYDYTVNHVFWMPDYNSIWVVGTGRRSFDVPQLFVTTVTVNTSAEITNIETVYYDITSSITSADDTSVYFYDAKLKYDNDSCYVLWYKYEYVSAIYSVYTRYLAEVLWDAGNSRAYLRSTNINSIYSHGEFWFAKAAAADSFILGDRDLCYQVDCSTYPATWGSVIDANTSVYNYVPKVPGIAGTAWDFWADDGAVAGTISLYAQRTYGLAEGVDGTLGAELTLYTWTSTRTPELLKWDYIGDDKYAIFISDRITGWDFPGMFIADTNVIGDNLVYSPSVVELTLSGYTWHEVYYGTIAPYGVAGNLVLMTKTYTDEPGDATIYWDISYNTSSLGVSLGDATELESGFERNLVTDSDFKLDGSTYTPAIATAFYVSGETPECTPYIFLGELALIDKSSILSMSLPTYGGDYIFATIWDGSNIYLESRSKSTGLLIGQMDLGEVSSSQLFTDYVSRVFAYSDTVLFLAGRINLPDAGLYHIIYSVDGGVNWSNVENTWGTDICTALTVDQEGILYAIRGNATSSKLYVGLPTEFSEKFVLPYNKHTEFKAISVTEDKALVLGSGGASPVMVVKLNYPYTDYEDITANHQNTETITGVITL